MVNADDRYPLWILTDPPWHTDAVGGRSHHQSHSTAVNVVEKVAEIAKRGEVLSKGKAFSQSNGSWVAEFVQIADTPVGLRVEKIWIAADVGSVRDTDILAAQLTSTAIFGMSEAMSQQITLANGMVQHKSFPDENSVRINQCPAFKAAILQTAPKMGHAGKIGAPPVAPAQANAIFALTGISIRSLPSAKEIIFA